MDDYKRSASEWGRKTRKQQSRDKRNTERKRAVRAEELAQADKPVGKKP